MVRCSMSFHLSHGELTLDCDFVTEVPVCAAAVGVELGFDDLPRTVWGVVRKVRWWSSSGGDEVEIDTDPIEVDYDLEGLGRDLLSDDRVKFVEYGKGTESVWCETRG